MRSLLFIVVLSGFVGCATTPQAPEPLPVPAVEPVASMALPPMPVPEPLVLPLVEPSPDPIRVIESANAAALIQPTADDFVRAHVMFAYHPGAIYRVDAAVHRPTDIILQPGERLLFFSKSDPERWQIEAILRGEMTHLVVMPTHAKIRTRLTMVTDRGAYYLDLRANASTSLTAVSWRHPPKPQPPEPMVMTFGVGYGLIDGDSLPWKPQYVWDTSDGKTMILFPAQTRFHELPVLYGLDHQGERQLTNYRMTGPNLMMADRLLTKAQLKLGSGDSGQSVTILRSDQYRHVICPGGDEACAVIQSAMRQEPHGRTR